VQCGSAILSSGQLGCHNPAPRRRAYVKLPGIRDHVGRRIRRMRRPDLLKSIVIYWQVPSPTSCGHLSFRQPLAAASRSATLSATASKILS